MENSKLNVLIVEDEPLISIFIKKIVLEMGENVVGVCYNSNDALELLNSNQIDLIFMDINIQGPLDGISVMRKARIKNEPTLFFVSAYSDKETIEDALSTNPYSYIVKPIKEEDIKIAVSLARKDQNKTTTPQKNHLIFSETLYYDFDTATIYSNQMPIMLSSTEHKLLNLFVSQINSSLSVETIKTEIWSGKDVSATTVRDAVSNLRKKIPTLSLQTVFGVGYTLVK